MDDKSYAWLLSELYSKSIPLKILETGICRGSKLLNWYYTNHLGIINSKPLKVASRTKLLLNYFLNQRVPILEEYNPEKVICYLYHRKGAKVVNAKDAIDLAENQLHGLQVRSIHLALSSSVNYYKVYRMHAYNDNGELQNTFTYGKFSKELGAEVKDPVIFEKALSLTLYISELMHKHYLKYIASIKLDLACDTTGQIHVIKVRELLFTSDPVRVDSYIRGNVRTVTMKMNDNSNEEIITGDNLQVPLKIIHEKDLKKFKDMTYKIQLKKLAPENSTDFLQMIAKTFDRERKNLNYLR